MSRRAIYFTVIVAAFAFASGCGAKYSPVSGVVTLDGVPVEGATVNFITEDGKKTFSGQTDASGNFSLVSGDKPGAIHGGYKVTVLKSKKVEGDMSVGGADYTKMMAKQAKESDKATKPGVGPPSSPTTGSAGIKTELPQVYSSPNSTPLTASVPDGQYKFELKSPAKK